MSANSQVVEYKAQTLMEEQKKKMLDMQLNFIVGQTEKFSSWLQEGLNKPQTSRSVSKASSITSKQDGSWY